MREEGRRGEEGGEVKNRWGSERERKGEREGRG